MLLRPLALIAALAACAPAADAPPKMEVRDAWARPSVAGQASGAAYLTLANTGGTPDRLVSVAAEGASSAIVHETSYESGIARMRMLDRPEIPAGGELAMKPGGVHVMLNGLQAPLTAGQSVKFTLRFERSGPLTATAEVRQP